MPDGRKNCFVEVFGEDTVKNPYASANYLMNKPHVLAHIKALLSSERFEMETMAVKLQVTETLKAIMDGDGHFGLYRPFRCAALSGTAQGRVGQCRQGADGYLPHQAQGGEPPAYRGSDGNVIFNVIVPQNPVKDGEAET